MLVHLFRGMVTTKRNWHETQEDPRLKITHLHLNPWDFLSGMFTEVSDEGDGGLFGRLLYDLS